MPVAVANGNKYQCALRSTDASHDITVNIKSENDFIFTNKVVQAGTAGTTIIIEGKFRRPEEKLDFGQVVFDNISLYDGKVSCSRAS